MGRVFVAFHQSLVRRASFGVELAENESSRNERDVLSRIAGAVLQLSGFGGSDRSREFHASVDAMKLSTLGRFRSPSRDAKSALSSRTRTEPTDTEIYLVQVMHAFPAPVHYHVSPVSFDWWIFCGVRRLVADQA
jgi:hypothetical protein